MSLLPYAEEDPTMTDLCLGCGRELHECICRDELPDDDPLEDGYDPDWDDYEEGGEDDE